VTEILVTYRRPGGQGEVAASADLISKHNGNEFAIVAEALRVDLADFTDWQESSFSAQCVALTIRSKRCRCFVTGGHGVELHTFISKRGGVCWRHEEKA
jgi:hypothetical protein